MVSQAGWKRHYFSNFNWIFPSEGLPPAADPRDEKQVKHWCPKKNTHQCSWILRHLHGLLLLPEVALIIIKVFRWVLFSPGVHRPELLWHEVVHKESHALNHAQQHATHHSWTHLWYGACQDNFSIRNFTMLLGPCLAAITAPAAAPDMMEFQGSWLREEVQDHFKYKKAKMNLFSSDVGECAVKRGETNTPSCKLTTKERSSAKMIYVDNS